MLSFEPINADNILKTSEYFKYKLSRTSDYTIGAMYMWRDFYDTCFTIYNNMIFYKVRFMGRTAFTFPAGSGDLDGAMNELKEYCKYHSIPMWFCTVPKEAVEILTKKYNAEILCLPNRDWSDYLYLAEDLAYMAGRRFSGQRNHINKFIRLYPDYRYERINSSNLDRVIEFMVNFQLNYGKDSDLAKEEMRRAMELMPYVEKFKLSGGFIEADDKIVAMTVGEVINDTMYCHIEKADRNYPGAYQMIVKEYASDMLSYGIKYINREEDVGDEGLRTSKLSYHPVEILDKYCVRINN